MEIFCTEMFIFIKESTQVFNSLTNLKSSDKRIEHTPAKECISKHAPYTHQKYQLKIYRQC